MSRTVQIAVSAILGAAAVTPLYAQDAAGSPEREAAVETVTILGTARADKTELTSTAPVDVITPEQLEQTGAVTINQALSKLHPSFNFPQGQNAVKGQGVRSASLRGVGPAYTLVLVNGKRRNVSAQLTGTDPWPAAQVVDLNVIPFSAVDHIEVLRDGAAAQYGSDAIAGVINIVLKNSAHGGDVAGRFGGYDDGGGRTYQLSGTKGLRLGSPDSSISTSTVSTTAMSIAAKPIGASSFRTAIRATTRTTKSMASGASPSATTGRGSSTRSCRSPTTCAPTAGRTTRTSPLTTT
ncbi:MAG: TonB-dependent receptor plug domain-containing protein [Gammaproteobacteria bacterium]